MASFIDKVVPTSLGGTLDESTLNDEQKKLLAQQKAQAGQVGMKKGGKVKSASQRADGCCIRGKTRA
jgi:hypothetical protein